MQEETNEDLRLAELFEQHRGRLRGVAYRMLGSLSDAEDAVQEAWLRLSRSDADSIENLGGWLTTVVARVCLNVLRSRREEPLGVHLPDPIIQRDNVADPEREALLSDSVGLALLLVLETLTPAERLAFVLHDMFAVPFDDIAPIVDRTPAAAMQLASRARRRVRGSAPVPDPDLSRQRTAVQAFLSAARNGDFEALVAVLDPDVVLRAQQPDVMKVLRGATPVAKSAILFNQAADAGVSVPALVNGAAGVVAFRDGKPLSVLAFTVVGDRIVEIDIIADPDRLARLDLWVSDPG